jgi:ssDNA-binding Zn-finger/Zn-ribbon topoisomerase 1
MTCPDCSQSFPLTWSRYARSLFGSHTCPHCRERSAFRASATYLAFVIIAWFVVYGVAIGFREAVFHTSERATLLWFSAIFVVGKSRCHSTDLMTRDFGN